MLEATSTAPDTTTPAAGVGCPSLSLAEVSGSSTVPVRRAFQRAKARSSSSYGIM